MDKKLKLIFTILLFLSINGYSTDYYVSATGNDAQAGTSEATAWQTIAKVNTQTLSAGDRVLFRRGDVFYGKLIVKNGGNSSNRIIYGSYGIGAKPVITGFTTVTNWTDLGSNIWESTSAVSTLSTCNLVSIGGENIPMGRYPNTGWLVYETFSGMASITSSALSGGEDWTGAEVVIRKQHWVIDRGEVTSQSGTTINYTVPSTTYNGKANYGFFIQDDARTLDAQNEWYYNPSTKKLKIYSTSNPGTVKLATIDTLVSIRNKNYITLDGLAIEGSNMTSIELLSSANVTIQNCDINYSGNDAISGNKNGGSSAANFVCSNNTIRNTNNNAVFINEEFSNPLITQNTITKTALIPGVSGSGSNGAQGVAIQVIAADAEISYNMIDSVGYNGIDFRRNNTLVQKNLVKNFCMVKSDGAGIYTWVGTGSTPFTGQQVLNNIVINGIGNGGGTADGELVAHGIYMDDATSGVEIAHNTVIKAAYSGLYIHNAKFINAHHNTLFDNEQMQAYFASFDASNTIDNCTFENNILVSKEASQEVMRLGSYTNDLTNFGTFDNNIYARPVSAAGSQIIYCSTSSGDVYRTLAQWKSFSSMDASSIESPKTVDESSKLAIAYNATNASGSQSLPYKYSDFEDAVYNGTITLPAYGSQVLFYVSEITGNTPPTVDAGADQNITLPVDNVNVSGTVTPGSADIASYLWEKISGGAATIVNPANVSTTITGLEAGTYVFSLTATDDNGEAGSDELTVIVTAAPAEVPRFRFSIKFKNKD